MVITGPSGSGKRLPKSLRGAGPAAHFAQSFAIVRLAPPPSLGLIVVVIAAVAAGCRKNASAERPSAARERAERVWVERCQECHGADGKGKGPRAKELKTKPRDFTDAEWQKGELDQELEAVILAGGKALGYSDEMPAHPDLGQEPEVVRELVKKIREFAP